MLEYACAKLNLTLEVGEKRSDGYHELRSVMTSASLCDVVDVEKAKTVTLMCDRADLPIDGRNLAVKAAELFFAETGINGGCHIALEKHIPSEAGLGGGSSDAAAVLRALRVLYVPEMPMEKLEAIGAKVGSDVPYCVRGGTVLCEGRGEKLTDLPTMPKCWYVIVKPQEAFSTGKMYGEIDEKNAKSVPTTNLLIGELKRGNLPEIAIHMSNTFLEVIPEESEVFAILKALKVQYGALNAMMSGSGSAVFGIFADEEVAKRAYEGMQRTGRQIFLCESV